MSQLVAVMKIIDLQHNIASCCFFLASSKHINDISLVLPTILTRCIKCSQLQRWRGMQQAD